MVPTTPNLGIATFDKKNGWRWCRKMEKSPSATRKKMGFSTTLPFSRPRPKAGATQLDLFILPPSLDPQPPSLHTCCKPTNIHVALGVSQEGYPGPKNPTFTRKTAVFAAWLKVHRKMAVLKHSGHHKKNVGRTCRNTLWICVSWNMLKPSRHLPKKETCSWR